MMAAYGSKESLVNVFRMCVLMTMLAAVVAVPLALPAPAQAHGGASAAGIVADIYVYDLYAAAPGGQWSRVGSYFVTVYRGCGTTDWGGLYEGRDAWSAAGYYTWISPGRYWRTSSNG
jgi:hypothetical protein